MLYNKTTKMDQVVDYDELVSDSHVDFESNNESRANHYVAHGTDGESESNWQAKLQKITAKGR